MTSNDQETCPIAELIPYIGNARTHSDEQVGQLQVSMRKFGWTIPVLVDEKRGMIAGHGRVLAAAKLYDNNERIRGLNGKLLPKGHAPILVAKGWTDAQKRAYVIADNKLALNSAWDEDRLKDELAALSDEDISLDAIGFTADELDDLIGRGGGDPIGDPPEGRYTEQFGVVVVCKDEPEQKAVYERLRDEGLNCRVVKV